MTVLSAQNMSAAHGQLSAVQDVDLSLVAGEMLFVVGANGAGKTTLLRSISGDHRQSQGTVTLSGVDISCHPAHLRARSGLALVPEGRRLFADLTVRENLLLGASTARSGPWSVDAIYDRSPNLAKLDQSLAGKLSGGEQQAVAIGRALMGNPVAIMLDEVSLGLSPAAVELAYATLARVRDMGIALLVVEQDLNRALATADQLVVMCEGRVTLRAIASETDAAQLAAASFGQTEGAAA